MRSRGRGELELTTVARKGKGWLLNYGAVGREVWKKNRRNIFFFKLFSLSFFDIGVVFCRRKKEKGWWNYWSYCFFGWIERNFDRVFLFFFFFFREAEGSDFEVRW